MDYRGATASVNELIIFMCRAVSVFARQIKSLSYIDVSHALHGSQKKDIKIARVLTLSNGRRFSVIHTLNPMKFFRISFSY